MTSVEFVQLIITAVITPLVGFAVAKLIEFIDSKIKAEKADKYLSAAEDAIMTAVRKIMQIYVDTLKKNGKWTEETAAEAFKLAKAEALKIMSGAVQAALPDIVGDLDAWLSAKIEAATLLTKMEMAA
jgi:hypothetical protein